MAMDTGRHSRQSHSPEQYHPLIDEVSARSAIAETNHDSQPATP